MIIDKTEDELLKMAFSMGIINYEDVRKQIMMKKKAEILEKHGSCIWYSESENCWYCHIPDATKKGGRRKVKRKKKEDNENILCEYWMEAEKQNSSSDTDTTQITSEPQQEDGINTISDLFYEFMEYKRNQVSTGTIKRMKADWEKFYVPHEDFIQKPFRSLTKIDMDNFFNEILTENDIKKKGFYNMCGILKQMLQYAEDAEYISKNPYRLKINKKKFVPTKKKPATQEVYQGDEKTLIIQEMERRLSENPSNTACLAVILDFELGLRKGEMMALRYSDIQNEWIHIQRQLIEDFDISDIDHIHSKGFKVVDYTKSEDGDRWLPLTEKAIKTIQKIQEINEEYGESYGDYLFVRDGYVMSPDTVDAQLVRGCQYIGIPIKTMHKIRKTYASTLLHNGVNISVVKEMLGHADESTTLRHYVYNTETNETTGDVVKKALIESDETSSEKVNDKKVTRSDQKIVSFQTKKKTETPDKSSISAS